MNGRLGCFLAIAFLAGCGSSKDHSTTQGQAATSADEGNTYFLSVYYVPADGADATGSLLNDAAYQTPEAVMEAEVEAEHYGSGLLSAGYEGLSHSIGHAYVDMFYVSPDGTPQHDDPNFPTGQTGGGDATDVIETGPGGTILGTYAGSMNAASDAANDIAIREQHHGQSFNPGVLDPTPNLQAAQLIGRTDFQLSQGTWTALKARIQLHVQETSSRYALMLEPAKQTQQPGQTGGEGAGCTSFAAMTMVFSGAVARNQVNPLWTRSVTVGGSLVDPGSFSWGSHVSSPWPYAANIEATTHGVWNALTYSGAWVHSDDQPFTAVPLDGSASYASQSQVTGYWYDPDYMYYWVKSIYDAALASGGSTTAVGRTWVAMNTLASNGPGSGDSLSYPYLQVDATDGAPKPTWDTCTDTYNNDWGACQ